MHEERNTKSFIERMHDSRLVLKLLYHQSWI